MATSTEKKAAGKKQQDPFRQAVLAAAFANGFPLLNVLVIGDNLEGMMPVVASGANAYYFTTIEKGRGHNRPISKINEYKGMLYDKFDVVISRDYNPMYAGFAKDKGFYLTLHIKPETLNGYYDPATKLAAVTMAVGYPSARTGNDFTKEIQALVTKLAKAATDKVYIPDIDKTVDLNISDTVTVTHKGLRTNPFTAGLLATYNETMSVYNPLYTTYTGVVDAFHKFPSTAFVSLDERIENLRKLGFKVEEDEKARTLSKRIAEKFEFLTTPLMPLLPQQALAYIKEGEHTAKERVPRLGIVKGRSYQVRVGWQKRVDTTPTGTVKKGYMTMTVNGHTLFEDRQQDVVDYIKAFGLPKIGSMADLHPEIVQQARKTVDRLFPKVPPAAKGAPTPLTLDEFQREDVALMATKPGVYVAHDRSLGKSVMSAAWGKVRNYKKALIATRGQYLPKWEEELQKFGFTYEWLNDWNAVARLKERMKNGHQFAHTTFFLTSFEFLGLENGIRMDPWTCVEKDHRGYLEAVIKDIKTTKCPSCGKTVGQARKTCPSCGSTDYTGRYCKACKTPSYTYKRNKPLTPELCQHIELQAIAGRNTFCSGTYPAYRKIKKLFRSGAIFVDEAQDIKNKLTLRSTATRSLHSRGKLIITANLMKNWPNELFWPMSWLLGFNNPMFPYKHSGGYPFFAEQFGTDIYKGIGKNKLPEWQRVPDASNLPILWKLMASSMVRRLKTDIEGAPKPNIQLVKLEMDGAHAQLYHDVRQSKIDALSSELLKENPDIHIIKANLWSLRAASTIPVAGRYFPQVPTTYSGNWNKLSWILDMCKDLQSKGKKALIFSTLIDMSDHVNATLTRAGITSTRISLSTKNRYEAVKRFNNDSTTALCSSPELVGKSYDIEKASVVIFADCGWTPEEHEQAMDRAMRIMLSMDPVDVYFLLNKNTIDIHMYDMVFQKGEAIKNVLDRRAVYQTPDAIIEAVQIKVAKAIVAERHIRPVLAPTPPPPIADSKACPEEIPWAPIQAFGPIEQLSLFGGPTTIVKMKTLRGKAA